MRLIVHVDLLCGAVRRRTIKLPKETGHLEHYLHQRMTSIFGRISSLLSYHHEDDSSRCSYCKNYPPYVKGA